MHNLSGYAGTIGLPSVSSVRPVHTAIIKQCPQFSCSLTSRAQLIHEFRGKKKDIALLPPLEYARSSSEVKIIPGVGISSRTSANSVRLYFNKGLHHIETVAVNPAFSSEIVLAHILLNECYQTTPKIVPMEGGIERLLSNANACLIVEDSEFLLADSDESIDLIDLWIDYIGLPYVHDILVCNEQTLLPNDLAGFLDIGNIAQQLIEQEVNEVGEEEITNESTALGGKRESLGGSFYYRLGEDEIESIKEFFRLAYYYRILHDIPDLRFHTIESTKVIPN